MTANENDPHDLARFLDAQRKAMVHVVRELETGRKEGHWIWYVFPQIRGLGKSYYSELYGISGAEEASAYLAHPVLRGRLESCVNALLRHEGSEIGQILPSPDDLKFHSSLTLFDIVEPGGVYARALAVFFGGKRDEATMDIVGRQRMGILRRCLRTVIRRK
jgi:uncharacterized protein (DUF1810 family)